LLSSVPEGATNKENDTRSGSKAAARTALIFCCDSIFLFSVVPLLIAVTDGERRPLLHAGSRGAADRCESADHVGLRRSTRRSTPYPSAGRFRIDAAVRTLLRWVATAVLMVSLPPALNVFVIARQNDTWIEPASVAVLIGMERSHPSSRSPA
jgi:malonate transporter and related proteins